ncbi:hypothetical protein [Maritimibacter sp. 55A14]|uniref:hypothetical protein n=1 Tax=Maritimibacter sp. 55A14 TaxID=2174844 RepID=UPI001304CB0F|nr:hypothetical protein [Maritimibacter sp. 55A14]
MRYLFAAACLLSLASCGVPGEPTHPATTRQLEVGSNNSIVMDSRLGKADGKYGVSVGF